MYRLLNVLLSGFLLLPISAISQQTVDSDTTHADDLFSLSLEELMAVSITSASREKEDLFDAPLSAYSITRKDIEKAGSTSIPEALRLCPAVFVTEMSNGTYQVDIRGLNNVPSFGYEIANKATLVMIDERPVFNQFQGGTFWENLPVDINDVERIEVVCGPSAALYGPNAVSGVINIITRKLANEGPMLYSNSAYDFVTDSYMANLSAGYKINQDLSLIVSGNYNKRNRHVVDYYYSGTPNNTGEFLSYDEISDANVIPAYQKHNIYPDPNLAVNKGGANIYIDYNPSSKIKFNVTSGLQQSDPLRMVTLGLGSTMAYYPATSWYVKAKAELNGFMIQASNNQGNQSFFKGISSYRYDFRTTDLYLDYTYKYKNILSLRPALSYQNAYITDLPYLSAGIQGVFNNSASMYNYAGSLKVELTPSKMWRLVAALRGDSFRYPQDKSFLSYEFVANFKPNTNHNIRLIASRAFQGSYIFPTYIDFAADNVNGFNTNFRPNNNLNLAHMDLLEAGYRIKITKNINADLSLFSQQGSSYSTLLSTLAFGPSGPIVDLKTENIELKAIQTGATLAFNAIFLNNMIQVKPFFTVSKVRLNNYSPYSNTPSTPMDQGLNRETYRDIDGKSTPSWYGGLFLNFAPNNNLNVNVNVYGYDQYSLYSLLEQPSAYPTAENPQPSFTSYLTSPASDLESNVMLNAKVSYRVHKAVQLYLNGRNITNNGIRQFYGGEKIGAMVLAGVLIDY